MAGIFALTGLLALSVPVSGAETEWVFVSVPDFLNADVGDLSTADGWDGGQQPQQPDQLAAIDKWLDAMVAEDPEFVLVAGDEVMGHWDEDADGRELFGPVDTLDEKRAAVREAGDVIYPQWQARFRDRGLTVHAAVGDHEIGDNPWPGDRVSLVETYKAVWAKHFTDGRYPDTYSGTAYTFQHRNLLVVTVDVFNVRDDEVHIEVTGGQLEWLNDVLDSSSAQYVIVQGHTPVIGPLRAEHSSELMLEDGSESQLWNTLCRHGVDLYFAGEFHDTTVNDGCVTQVVHGGNLNADGTINYLVVSVGPSGLTLTSKVADKTISGSRRVYQTGMNRPYANVAVSEFRIAGEAVYDGSWKGTGDLEPVSRKRPVVSLLGFGTLTLLALLLVRRRRVNRG